MAKIVVISGEYPSTEYVYGDVFVHSRVMQIRKYFDVEVVGYNNYISSLRQYTYEGIPVLITSNIELFYSRLIEAKPDIVIGHFVQHNYLDFILSIKKPLVIFFHGYEILSWRRRLMNYNSIGSLRYLLPYAISNCIQRRKLRRFVHLSNQKDSIHFVFVSNWLYNAAKRDLKISFRKHQIIPNGIDTDRFVFEKKHLELRRKILLLRSFKAKNYANDIAIDAILLLSKRAFFDELEFCIQGEGYLYKSLTEKIRHFKNVTFNNAFVENKGIPQIHKSYGIFLCPSRLDTQGVSMCEAMSSGLVPITTCVGGIPEYVEDGVSGFFANDSKGIADKIELLYRNPEVFAKMSINARKYVEDKCKLSVTAERELDLIQSLASPLEGKGLYKQCSRCVLDTHDDSNITFDQSGICSYCRSYENQESRFVKKGEDASRELSLIVKQIQEAGEGSPYDCIIGLSGGVDSTYLAYQAGIQGLRPLLVHFDNGWNSELAIHNIECVVNKTGFDLHTFVMDWEEFRDIQLSFLKASVVDIELVTDHAIITKLYQLAIKFNIKYILSGSNFVTESVLPTTWIHNKRDHIHIRAVHRKFGSLPLKTYPLFTSKLKWLVIWKGIKNINLLDLMPYNKAEVKQIIQREMGWRDYGGKHYESIFTRFYQGHILPVKFGIDKRKAHLSNLICSGQLTREEALIELEKSPYYKERFESDYEFVLKKLGLSNNEFEVLMNAEVKKHSDYPVEESLYERFPILKYIRPFWLHIKRFRQLK